MAWIKWGLILSVGFLLSPGCEAAERQHSLGGFSRLYVLQPGPEPGMAGPDSGVRVSSISTRPGPAGQPNSYDLELSARLGGPVRTRRMGKQRSAAPQEPPTKLSGVNVCGGQCCHGWSTAQGSQRCTKPNCFPQCQNGGMCLRPQLCVCKPGSKGNACEQKVVPTQPFPAGRHTNEHNPGHTNGHTTVGHTNGHNVVPQRPIPQQGSPNGYTSVLSPTGSLTQMKLTVKPRPKFLQPHYIQQHIQQQIRNGPVHPGQSQQLVLKPKYYHTGTTHTQTHPQADKAFPLTVGHNPSHGRNHTGRIKVVFTPTICKLTCIGGRCHNNCELGNTTTIISENGHTTDTLTAPSFRVVVCHLPCMNGGRCSTRDKCQCPLNFTGKFCQMPVKDRHQQQMSGGSSQTQVHSTHTLPLTYSNGQSQVLSPGIVNIHIKHPPEASVQVHQVSQLENFQNNGHRLKGSLAGSTSSTSYSYHHRESSQKIQHHGYNLIHPSQNGYQFPLQQPVTTKNALGRCFQETAGSQCGKVLPGLTKQEQCCGTIGTSWGFHKCHKCPKKSSIPLIDCPQGYKRINTSHCQDLDECQLRSVCPNGNCLNTVGSYRCTCKPGFVPDSTFTTCISTFKEICPGGMGYTILPNPPVKGPGIVYQEPTDLLLPQLLPTPERSVEAFGTPEVNIVVVERTSPPAPVEILPSNAGQDIAPTQSSEVDECHINPYICGPGICYNTAEGYTCHCDEGYHLDDAQTTCIDLDECQNEGFCIRGHCENTQGSFGCHCGPGFRASAPGDQCDDVDECLEEARPCGAVGDCVNVIGSYTCTCLQGYRQVNATSCRDVDECMEEAELCLPHGRCLNTEGTYRCVCDSGFTASLSTPVCDDIDECFLNKSLCGQHGFCDNRVGSFKCLCDQGYQEAIEGDGCEDVNECDLLSSVCGEAQCVNVDGSFLCVCPSGQDYNVMIAKCEHIPTASAMERKECYYRLNDENLCESVLTSHVTLQECCCTLGAGWGDNCEVHPCPVNETNQFKEMCPSGRGFVPSGDLHYGVPMSNSYKDADECTLFDQEVCKGGFCLDTEGSYECYCKTGQDYDPATLECRDINECLDESVCVGGQCLNTDGSFMCFCTHPMVLDPTSNRCVFVPEVSEQHEPGQVDYQGICWQTVTETITCTRPLIGSRKTTYTECCCLFGEAWGMDCALCPPRNTEDYASMCNLPLSGGQQPYGHDALDAIPVPVHQYHLSQDYSPSPVPTFYEAEKYQYKAFEGLLAQECGVLNGCENGRCVRVQEGYICDCLDGYSLDLSRMTCIDVNECSELNKRMLLCRNAQCINTVGSYQCVCLPGFRPSSTHNYCVEAETESTSTQTQ